MDLSPTEIVKRLLDPPGHPLPPPPSSTSSSISSSTSSTSSSHEPRLVPTQRPKLHVTLTDGRVVIGTLTCIDHSVNLILTDVVERRSEGDHSEKVRERTLNQVMVPGPGIAKVEVLQSSFDACMP